MLTPAPDTEAPTVSPAAARQPQRLTVRLAAAVAALLAVVVYANTLLNGLVYDDRTVILTNEAAQHPLDLGAIFLTSSWAPKAAAAVAYRPLTTWTFAVNFALHGEHPLGYHLVNVLAHAAVAALIVVLATTLGLPVLAAGIAGALFAAHPIHTEAVANVVGRAEILAAGLALLALLWQRRAAEAGWPLRPSAWAAAAYGLALLAKEHAIALAALMPLADLVFSDGGSIGLFLRRLGGRRGLFYLALAALTAGYLALRLAALGYLVGDPETIAGWMNPAASAPALLRILTALKVQALALSLLVAPFELSADYSYPKIPVVADWTEPGAVAGLLLAAGLVALAAVLWWRTRTAFFWLALALLTYFVVSNIPFPTGTIFAERLLYLPSVGVCALVATLLALPRAAGLRAAGAAVAAVLVAVWGTSAGWRNRIWYDDIVFGEALVKDAPESVHAHHVLGTTYASAGRDEEALHELAEALKIDPKNVGSLYNAGVIYQRRNQDLVALTVFRKVVDIEPKYFPAWINIASVNNSQAMFTPALDAAEHAIAIRSDVPNAYVVKGFALRGLERLDEAKAAFEDALRIAPENPEALLGLGATAVDKEDLALAASAFERLVKVFPSQDAYRGLVYSDRRLGRTEDAERAASAARERYPDDAFFAPEPAPPPSP